MKIIKILSIITTTCIIFSSFAYTSDDVYRANYLATKKIIKDWSSNVVNYRLNDAIIRSEVIGMALAVKGITRKAHCDGYFVDVPKSDTDWLCRTIETAAEFGLINNQKDIPANLRKARPKDFVTRAEALALMEKAYPYKVSQGYNSLGVPVYPMHAGDSDLFFEEAKKKDSKIQSWQSFVFYLYETFMEGSFGDLRVNEKATRSEVFEFAYNIVRQKVEVTTIKTSQKISSPLHITGYVYSNWYFEGTFPITVKSDDGTVLASANAQVETDKEIAGYAPFSADITFQKKGNKGVIIFEKENPSGIPEKDRDFTIQISF